MYTTHSLHEMRTSSASPTVHVPREAGREFDLDGLYRAADELTCRAAPWTAARRLARAVLDRLAALAGHAGPATGSPAATRFEG